MTVPHFHILQRKELENYLLVPEAIAAAIADRLGTRGDFQKWTQRALAFIDELSEEMKSDVLAQTISNRMRYFGNRTSKGPATIAAEAITKLDSDWTPVERRMTVVPGKQLIAMLNSRLQQNLGISITAPQIIRNLSPELIANDLREILSGINQFAKQA